MGAISTVTKSALGLAFTALLLPALAATPAQRGPSFNKQVQPILDANCVACHQTGSAQQGLVLESGLAFGALAKSSSELPSMKLIQPGSADTSYLFRKVSGSHMDVGGKGARMPLGGALQADDVDTIQRWIAAGAKND